MYEAEDLGEIASRRFFDNTLDLLQSLIPLFVVLNGARNLVDLLLSHPLLIICIRNVEVVDVVSVLDLVNAMLLVLFLFGFVERLEIVPV